MYGLGDDLRTDTKKDTYSKEIIGLRVYVTFIMIFNN